MIPLTVTREHLPQCVEVALNECTSLLNAQQGGGNNQLIRDLQAASSALRLIEAELRNGHGRPKHQRSGAFTRYVIDENGRIVMEAELKDFIVRIEDVYKRI